MGALTSQAQQGSTEEYSQSDHPVHDYGGSPFFFFFSKMRSCPSRPRLLGQERHEDGRECGFPVPLSLVFWG